MDTDWRKNESEKTDHEKIGKSLSYRSEKKTTVGKIGCENSRKDNVGR
jgi:hypothetical protein